MSEGTSLDDIESGTIENQADNAVMNAILSDMNAVDPDQSMKQPRINIEEMSVPQHIPMLPPIQPQPQHHQHQPMFESFQEATYEDHYQPIPQQSVQYPTHYEQMHPNIETITTSTKKNTWSSLLDFVRDPIVVGLIVCLFSLPEIHTRLGKYVGWAYKVGGALSWSGLVVQSFFAAALFAGYQYIMTHTSILDFVKSL